MRNNNFRKLETYLNMKCVFDGKGNSNNYSLNVVATDGKSHAFAKWYNSQYSDFRFALIGGSGSTPPTEDDYNLESPIALSSAGQTFIYDGNHTIIIVEVLKNTSSEAATITEVACKVHGGTSYDWYGDFIISRDLITPITIPAGETRTIQYTIEF